MLNKSNAVLKFLSVLLVLILYSSGGYTQDIIPREYVSDSSKISLIKELPFDVALKAINDIGLRQGKKPIIDLTQRKNPIGVDIINKTISQALQEIITANDLTLIEMEAFFQIVGVEAGAVPGQAPTETPGQETDATLAVKPVTSELHEVRISATFFSSDRTKFRESGLNWQALLTSDDVELTLMQSTVGKLSDEDIGAAEVIYNRGKNTFTTVFKAMESNNYGEVLASPHLTVLDGRLGSVQIGQDISINTRDFAGNLVTEMIQTGIMLNVTPTIIDEDTILFIHLDVTVDKSSAVPGGATIVVNTTSVSAELLLLDGEEVTIGGLFTTGEVRGTTGIPLLKRIPKWFFGLGYIFGYESITITNSELIILLKVELLPSLYERLKRRRIGGN